MYYLTDADRSYIDRHTAAEDDYDYGDDTPEDEKKRYEDQQEQGQIEEAEYREGYFRDR